MATNTKIKFYKRQYQDIATAKTQATGGAIVFDEGSHSIFVNGLQYGGNIADASFSGGVLTITKADAASTVLTLDFNNLATAESVMQVFKTLHNEIDAIETGAGLGADGTYTANSNANYISDATSLANADNKLDAAIKAANDRIDSLSTDAVKDIDINGTSIVDASDGEAHISVDGTYNASTNKIATQTTVTNAINALDTQNDVQAVDYTAAVAGTSGAKLTFKGVSETNGVIAQGSGATELQFAEVATTGAAANVSIADSGNLITATDVEGALQEIAGKSNTALQSISNGTDGDYVTTTIGTKDSNNNQTVAVAVTVQSVADADSSDMGLAEASDVKNYVDNSIAALDTVSDVTVANLSGTTLSINGVKETDGIVSATTSPQATIEFKTAPTSGNKVLTESDVTGIVGAMVYRGAVDSQHALPASPATGDVYMVAEAGTYASQACEVGDMIVYNGTTWDVINGENQVTNENATITVGDSNATDIAVVDGTTITAKVSVTGGNATIASKSGDVVTLKAGVTQTGTSGTIGNNSNSDITLAAVATTGAAANVSIADQGGKFDATTVEDALAELDTKIDNTIDGLDVTEFALGSKTNNVITLKGIKETDGKIATGTDTANDITFAAVAATGDASDVAFDNSGSDTALTSTNVQDAIEELEDKITGANITIDGHKGAITTGLGLTDVAADGGSFGTKVTGYVVNNAGTNSDALDLDSTKIDSAYTVANTTNLATVATVTAAIDTLDVTEYALGSKDSNNVITLTGIKEENGKIAAGETTSNNIVFAAVAATGAASDVTYSNTSSQLTATSVQAAIDELDSAIDDLKVSETEVTSSDGSIKVTPDTDSDGKGTVYNVELVWEEYE